MKTEIIKPKKEKKEQKSILTPIIYLILGFLLAFKSNEAVKLLFYVIGILIIIYGLKNFVIGYKNMEDEHTKNIHMGIAGVSLIIGILVMILSGVLEASSRYVLGFFLAYMGVSRMITEINFGNKFSWANLSNIILIVLGVYSIFFSNAVLVIIGVILILNAVFLIWDYIKGN